MTDHWYTDHANLVTLTRYLVREGFEAEDIADAVEKPYHYEVEFRAAVKAAG